MTTGTQFDPNLLDEDRSQNVLITLHLFTILIILTGGGRLAVKLIYHVKLRVADYLIFFALAGNLAANICEYRMVRIGFGRHTQFLPSDAKIEMKMLGQIGVFLAFVVNWAIKTSISCFLLGLICDTHPRFRRVLKVLIVLIFVIFTANAIVWGLQAHPIEKLWNPNIPGEIAPTFVLVDSIYAFAALNVITDLIYALSPIYFFGKLQMDRRKKLLLLALTGSGILVVVISIVRCIYLTAFFDPDFSWALPPLYVYSLTERNLGEVLADLPAIYPLLRDLANGTARVWSRTSRGSRTRESEQTGHALSARSGSTYPASAGLGDSRNAFRPGPFGAYGYKTNFSSAEAEEDEIGLRETASTSTVAAQPEGGISVQWQFSVQHEDR